LKLKAHIVSSYEMKILALLFVALVSSTIASHAGNMFGPAPFRNGSPLVSGIDGSYQATARASNITGIFRFAYSGGSQTTAQRQNNWLFFREGLVIRGDVEADINQSSLTGILSPPQAISASTNTNTISLPLVFVSSDSSSVGTFNGKFNLKSPTGAFSGEGVFQSGASQITTYTIVNTNGFPTTIPITNTSATGFTNNFYFRGVRTSTSSSSSVNSTN
jgi:hypothetical protein